MNKPPLIGHPTPGWTALFSDPAMFASPPPVGPGTGMPFDPMPLAQIFRYFWSARRWRVQWNLNATYHLVEVLAPAGPGTAAATLTTDGVWSSIFDSGMIPYPCGFTSTGPTPGILSQNYGGQGIYPRTIPYRNRFNVSQYFYAVFEGLSQDSTVTKTYYYPPPLDGGPDHSRTDTNLYVDSGPGVLTSGGSDPTLGDHTYTGDPTNCSVQIGLSLFGYLAYYLDESYASPLLGALLDGTGQARLAFELPSLNCEWLSELPGIYAVTSNKKGVPDGYFSDAAAFNIIEVHCTLDGRAFTVYMAVPNIPATDDHYGFSFTFTGAIDITTSDIDS